MSFRKEEYRHRLIYEKIFKYLKIFGAILIEGPNWYWDNHVNKNVERKTRIYVYYCWHYEAVIQDRQTAIYIVPITLLRP